MKIWAIIALISFLILMSWMYKTTQTALEVLIVTLVLIGIVWFAAQRMTWVFGIFSKKFDVESQRCVGWEMSNEDCFGIVENRY